MALHTGKPAHIETLTAPKIQNLTHMARLLKSHPNAGLSGTISTYQEKLNKYAEDLSKDQTKTHTEKIKLLNASGAKLSQALLPLADAHRQGVLSTIKPYQDRIDGSLKIQGTTDVVLLQSMSQAIRDEPTTGLLPLAEHDIDVARAALLLPVERYKRKLNKKPEMEKALRGAVARNLLGDEYGQFQTAKEHLNEAFDLGQYLMKVFDGCTSEVSRITAKEAQAPAE